MFIGYSVLIYSFLKKASPHHILIPTAHLHTYLSCPLMHIPIFHTHWTTYLPHLTTSFHLSIPPSPTSLTIFLSPPPPHLSFIPYPFSSISYVHDVQSTWPPSFSLHSHTHNPTYNHTHHTQDAPPATPLLISHSCMHGRPHFSYTHCLLPIHQIHTLPFKPSSSNAHQSTSTTTH